MVCLKLEPDWAFTQKAIIVLCRSELEARIRTKEEHWKWAEIAARFGVERVWLKYPNCKGNRFPIIDDIDGHLWQLGQNVAVRPIETPTPAR